MTTLYRPVLIESAEQAEALPVGTVTQHPGMVEVAVRSGISVDGKSLWYGTDGKRYDASSLVGWTALVPIEAEEEFTAMGTDDGEHWIAHVGPDGITGSREDAEQYTKRFGGFIARRYRTPWEEA